MRPSLPTLTRTPARRLARLATVALAAACALPAGADPVAQERGQAAEEAERVERELGVRPMRFEDLQPYDRRVSASELAAATQAPVNLQPFPALFDDAARYDEASLWREGGVIQLIVTSPLSSHDGYGARRIFMTCGGNRHAILQAAGRFARTATEAALLARNPSEQATTGPSPSVEMVEAWWTPPGKPNAAIQDLCDRAKPAPYALAVPISFRNGEVLSVPVRSIRKTRDGQGVGWVQLRHLPEAAPHPAWDAPDAPTEQLLHLAQMLSPAMYAVNCATGDVRGASLQYSRSLKLVIPGLWPDDGKHVRDLVKPLAIGSMFSCSAVGL